MSTPQLPRPAVRTTTLIAFVLACVGVAGYLYAQAGGSLPAFGRERDYTVSFDVEQVDNLVSFADVTQAGVGIGKVAALNRVGPDRVRVVLTLRPVAAPLHRGVTVQLGEKSLAGQPDVQVVDGTGPGIPDGSLLPAAAVKPPVTLGDVLASLDQPTRAALGAVIRSMSRGTDGRQHDISALAEGLADIGGNGHTALDAIAAQSTDLEQISAQLNQIFDALDAGQGQIAQLVSSADRLSAAAAGQRPALEATMRTLPGVLDSVTAASADIVTVSDAVHPVAADLRRAAPDLNHALNQLPAASHQLRALLPDLHAILGDAPATLHRIPGFGTGAREVFGPTTSLLRDLNPMLGYLEPYGRDIGQFMSNDAAGINHYGDDGSAFIYMRPVFSATTIRPDPLAVPGSVISTNPYPRPGRLADLRPFSGRYTRLPRDGG
jgi:phospholipid/cholesterol/gamma-HCH transport system substrate-binding protein